MQNQKTVARRPLALRVTRIVLKTIAFILLFVLVIFALLFTPPVQRFLTTRVQHYLENKLHTKVAIGRISFGLSGRVGLHNIYIEDKTRDTLLSGGLIKANVSFLKLLSNEVRVRDIEIDDVTAKIKRVLPDTVYNFQFVVDAFMSAPSQTTDTSTSAPMKLDINQVTLKNINVTYSDAVAGSDMFAHIGEFAASIDTIDPYTQHFAIPRIILRNSTARMKQVKPLVEPKPLAEHVAAATTPTAMNVQFGGVEVQNVAFDYANDVSAAYATANIGSFVARSRSLDMQHNSVNMDELSLKNSTIVARLGKTEQAKTVKQEAKKEATAQAQAGWNVFVSKFSLANNSIKFDDDNKPRTGNGVDFGHIDADNLSLAAERFVMTNDSTSVNIVSGSIREKSGLTVEELSGEILYAGNQSYVHNLDVRTPGSQIGKSFEVHYPSIEAVTKDPTKATVVVDLTGTRIQVRDILLLAPQLRSNPAFKRPNDVWQVNIAGSGNANQFNFRTLQFAGLGNTQLDAHGSLTGLTNPKNAGGDFVINRFHTTRSDIAVFAGDQLAKTGMNLPADMTASGTLTGNAGAVQVKLALATSDGSLNMAGRFANLADLNRLQYNAVLTARNVRVGKIMAQPAIGDLTATVSVRGKGATPETMNTEFAVAVPAVTYNQYNYKNIRLNGSLVKTNFKVNAIIKDPNADADISLAGDYSSHPSFSVHGMIDSIKFEPLHLATEPLIVRGRIDGTASDLTADNPTADIHITQGLFVSGANRLALDTVQLTSGRNGSENFMRFQSSVASAELVGTYKLAELGSVIQQAIQPYFAMTSGAPAKPVQPYDFRFSLNVAYDPIFAAFVPGLTAMQDVHASGRLSSKGGISADLSIPSIVYQGNTISGLNFAANSAADGLRVTGGISRLKSGSSFDLYTTRVNALVANNKVDFSLGVDDQAGKNKYHIAGLFAQPTTGTYTVQLKPDSLLLNYQPWTVSANNLITVSPDNIAATNFTLQSGDQRLSMNSPGDRGQQLLVVDFSNFRVATITGFIKADSVLADGVINGNVRLSNFLKQPNFTSDLTINDLSLRGDTIGNVAIKANSAGANRYNLETTITGKGNDVALQGWIENANATTNLNLDLNVRAIQLHSIEGATGGAIRNATGAINGTVAIRGTADKPLINGNLNFDRSSFVLSMLGSQFNLDKQSIAVTNDGLTFNKFTIKDSTGNALVFDGNVATTNFVNYNFNIKVTARDFQLLNSTKKDNPIYYGKMNISTDLGITGTESLPKVDGRITVNDGTALTFVVPQTQQGIEEREGIVQFVDMRNPANDSLFKNYDSLNKTSVLGMDVAVNIEIKKEALFNVIVDAANGDFLNAQGEALLTAGIDPSGKITMTGTYTLEQGAYQLSFNFLQRKFEIAKGSTITWTGEPTSAKLDVTAVYVANTSPLDLVQDQVEGSAAAIRNTYLQKLPFELHLNLTGELMKPIVAFDILLPEKNYGVSNDVVTTVQSKLDQVREDEGELNKQVFSLLLLNRFVGQNPFQSAGGGGGFNAGVYARQSASKLLTEQLNSLAAGLISGVDVNFDVASTEDYTTGSMHNRTDLNLNVSKRLLNDRLKVSVGSNFELEGPQNSNQQSNNIAGNVALDYQLSRDGRYLVRFFRRNNYEGEVDGYVIENGLSFIISVDYNRFREILHRRKQRMAITDNQQKERVK